MPIYEYQSEEDCEQCGGEFEVFQMMADDALSACPNCEKPCKRVISAVPTARQTGDIMKSSNLERLGFSMYKNQGDGTYDRVGGAKGPDRPAKLGANDPRIRGAK